MSRKKNYVIFYCFNPGGHFSTYVSLSCKWNASVAHSIRLYLLQSIYPNITEPSTLLNGVMSIAQKAFRECLPSEHRQAEVEEEAGIQKNEEPDVGS